MARRKPAPAQATKPARKRVPKAAEESNFGDSVRQTLRAVGETALEVGVSVLLDKIARAGRAPAHVVAAAGIINGMDPVEIAERVNRAMDDNGLD